MEIFYGALLLAAAVLMTRTALRTQMVVGRDVTAELQAETRRAQASAVSQIRALEVQILEQSRELQAELDNRRLMLDRLIADADERIRRLEDHIDEAATLPLRRAA